VGLSSAPLDPPVLRAEQQKPHPPPNPPPTPAPSYYHSYSFLLFLLLLAGDIHPNPGPPKPKYPCPICSLPVTRATWSFLCSSCHLWTHLLCSKLPSKHSYFPGWSCPSCSSTTPTPFPHPTSPSSLPSSSILPPPPHHHQDPAHTPPAPPHPAQPPVPPPPLRSRNPPLPSNSPAILQFNCNGLISSQAELTSFLLKNKIPIACLQETKLSPSSKLKPFPEYTLLRKDRPNQTGSSIAFLIHHSITYTHLNLSHLSDGVIELDGITMELNGSPTHIINIYLPPHSSCPPNYFPNFSQLLSFQDDSIILGDFNAHNPAWFSSTGDQTAANRGEALVEAINASDLCLLNEDTPTRLPSFGQPTSPDLSLCTAHLALSLSWHTSVTLNSDHLPILISFPTKDSPKPPRFIKTFLNFQKADWESFTSETEQLFSSLPPPISCSIGELSFRKILITASKHCIPAGHLKNFSPNIPTEAASLIRERDSLRQSDPTNPQISILNNQISSSTSQYARQRWQEALAASDHRLNPSKYWSLLSSLSGKRSSPPPNQPISSGQITHTSAKPISNLFCKQFTSLTHHKSNKATRKFHCKLRKSHPLDPSFSPFNLHLVQQAISKSSNSSAIGPDNLTIHHLKHLGPIGLSYLTQLLNLSVSSSNIPAIWKFSTIIPLLKPGKPPESSSSYRPISLLCPAAKVLERLILPSLQEHLLTHPTQHGFKSSHSTTSALLPLVNSISNGFNQKVPPKRTVAVAIDFSKAFDCIPHSPLLTKISNSSLPNNLVRWLSTYLRGRMAICSYNNFSSKARKVHLGVPQGSVISPILFNFYVSDCPSHTESSSSSYADDFTAYHSSSSIPESETILNSHLSSISSWASSNGLSIAPHKSTVTLFTSDFHQSKIHPQISIDNSLIP